MKSIVMDLLISQNNVSMTFFTERCAQNIFFIGESVCFNFMDYPFDTGSSWKIHV